MTGFAQLGLKAHIQHESFVIHLPDGLSVQIPAESHALHVVRQNIFGNAHVLKSVDHTDEQILLLGVGEELDIPYAAVVADHGEACAHKHIAQIVLHLHEAPVHLERFSGRRRISTATVSLRSYKLTLGRNKVAVSGNVVFYRGHAAAVPCLSQSLQANGRIRNTAAKHSIQRFRIAGKDCLLRRSAFIAMGLELKTIAFQPTEL